MTHPQVAKVLFLDSMVYTHYKPIEDVDWLVAVGAEKVTIVVPRVTLKELDKHKNTHPSAKIRDRVAGVLKRLEKYLPGGADLRPGVNISRYQRHPSDSELAERGLNAIWSDDVLIGTILLYRAEHPDAEVMLVTQDTGPKLTALDHDLKVLALPENLRLPAEQDPIQKENEQLRQMILKQQGARPELHLAFTGHDQPYIEILLDAPNPFPADKAKQTLTEIAAKHPRVTPGESKVDAYILPRPEEHVRYNGERETYLIEYEKYLINKWNHENAVRRSLSLSFSLFNSGMRPAEDIDIHLYIPDGIIVHEREPSSRTPGEPTPPKPVRSAAQMMAERITGPVGLLGDMSFGSASTGPFVGPESSGLTIKRTNSYEVTTHIQTLKHGYSVPIPPVHIEFESEQPSSFGIKYSLHPANLPESVDGELHVKVRVRYG